MVIDQDLGQSGASAADREGFQRLVAEVGLGHVGLVMGLEVSRLARSSLDWHHLLELCAMTATLILDEDGPGLLQGLVICGKCGNRMTIRYHQAQKGRHLIPEYVCQKERVEQATEQTCQHILGAGLDAAIADLLLAQVTPFTIDTALEVYEELHTQIEAAQHLREQQVERARYAAEQAQRRFLRVDPENRLVASVLEAEWNARLQEYTQVQEQAQKQQEKEQHRLSTLEQQAIANLVEDFPRVWQDERTLDRDRKRMVRLLLEDVTLRKDEMITAQVRFKGGATQTITLPISQGRRSAQEVLTLIDQLLDDYTDAEVAEQLNQRGWRTYEGKLFHATRILSLRAIIS